MQFYSMIAKKGSGSERTFFMFQERSLEQAADRARRLLRTFPFDYVEHGGQRFIRVSTRRETSLLQSYLSTLDRGNLHIYLREDLDAFLSRRGELVLSFFMALYFDPKSLKARFPLLASQSNQDPDSSATDESPSGGSGGMEIQGADPQVEASTDTIDITPNADPSVPDATSQEDALASLMSGDTSHSDPEIDLGGIF